jgi:hypothetical protein
VGAVNGLCCDPIGARTELIELQGLRFLDSEIRAI